MIYSSLNFYFLRPPSMFVSQIARYFGYTCDRLNFQACHKIFFMI